MVLAAQNAELATKLTQAPVAEEPVPEAKAVEPTKGDTPKKKKA